MELSLNSWKCPHCGKNIEMIQFKERIIICRSCNQNILNLFDCATINTIKAISYSNNDISRPLILLKPTLMITPLQKI